MYNAGSTEAVGNGLELCGYIAFCFAYLLTALWAVQGRAECEFGDTFVILVLKKLNLSGCGDSRQIFGQLANPKVVCVVGSAGNSGNWVRERYG
jgi:hypothetical protein